MRNNWRARGATWLAVLFVLAGWSAASAETLMMPKRDMQMGVSEVVWGLTTLPNSTSTFSINFGDGNTSAFATVTDRSDRKSTRLNSSH